MASEKCEHSHGADPFFADDLIDPSVVDVEGIERGGNAALPKARVLIPDLETESDVARLNVQPRM
jgi:hypothetical protein